MSLVGGGGGMGYAAAGNGRYQHRKRLLCRGSLQRSSRLGGVLGKFV